MSKKILKNNTDSTMQILNRDVGAGQQYDIPHGQWDKLADSEEIPTLISDGDIIVNNGEEDLSTSVALVHIKEGALRVHRPMNIIAGLGENCPELIQLNSASVGFDVEIGDKGYVRARADNIVGDFFEVEFHFCINNEAINKYITFKANVLTTCGCGDKYLNQEDIEYSFGPLDVETDPYKIFNYTIQLPTSLFQNNEKYIFIGLERIDNEEGYDEPTNNPIIVHVDQIYWKRVV